LSNKGALNNCSIGDDRPSIFEKLKLSVLSSDHGSGEYNSEIKLGIEKDQVGIESAKAIMNRTLELI
jgi:hypothetical protein